MRRVIFASTLAVVVLLTAAACGFRLQGRTPLPEALTTTYVQAPDSQTDFVLGLRKALLASGATLEDDPQRASSIVQIITDDVSQRVLSVSASNLPREYELTHTVRFSVRTGEKELLPVQEVHMTRDYTFDESILLAKEHEEAILREALAKDLVGVVMRRLSSL